jgi:hypothetical protein
MLCSDILILVAVKTHFEKWKRRIAAYITNQARLELYEYLRELRESVLYCDTDSVIYIQ